MDPAIISLIVSALGGAAGGNAVGTAVKSASLGTLGNSLSGLVGGGAVTLIIGLIKSMMSK